MDNVSEIQVCILHKILWKDICSSMQTSGKQTENSFSIPDFFLLCNKRLIFHCHSFNAANIWVFEKKLN